MDFFITPAWAQAAGSTAGHRHDLPLVLIFVVFFLLIGRRPSGRRASQMVGKLAAGDEVVTNGGILGRITEVSEHFVTLEVAANVAIRVQKFQVAQLMPKGTFKGA
jgi:preprotein translocase subunit YajC